MNTDTAIIFDDIESTTESTILDKAAGFAIRVKNTIQAWRERRKEARAAAWSAEIKRHFGIAERSGRIFLTCDGVAFQEIDPSQSAGTICELLDAARLDAQTFSSINR